MVDITKPSGLNVIWASGGDIIDPGDTKYQEGWDVEIPPRQWENFSQNKQDTAIAHNNQHGINVWDSETEYQTNKSYVQGPTDGVVYRCVLTNTNQNPETDVTDTYWTVAFASVGAFLTQAAGDARYAQRANNLSDLANVATARSNLGVATAEESTAYSPGYFYGFSLTNNSGAPNTTIDVASGAARDSTDTLNIKLTSTLRGILQSVGAWTAGDNQNKLDTGAKANSTTYYVFAIRKTSDGTADILFSLSATAPTMPTGYAGFRRTGRIVTDGSGNIRAFKQRGPGWFDWVTPITEVTAGPVSAGTSLLTLTGLGGGMAIARLQALAYGDGVGVKLIASDQTDSVMGFTETDFSGGLIVQTGGGSATESGSGEFQVAVDASSQVRLRTFAGAGTLRYRVLTMGWKESL